MKNKLADIQSQLTPYLSQHFESRYQDLPPHLQEKLLQDSKAMSQIGINSEEDHKAFIYILRHARHIGEELTGRSLTWTEVSRLADAMYQARTQFSPNSILGLYRLARHGLKEIGISIKKIAYPVEEKGMFIEPPSNIQKWMATMRTYYTLTTQGYPQSDALRMATNGWDEMERRDFKYWMSFYEEHAHNKYKTAQFQSEPRYYQAGEGAMIPLDHLKAKLPGMPDMTQYSGLDTNLVAEQQLMQQQARKQEVENFIKAIVGRLNAAERLVTKPEVQTILQKMLNVGLPTWLESLHRLKREIQTAPIQAAAALRQLKIKEISPVVTDSLIQDLLYKEANILLHQGKIAEAKLMVKLAQEAAPATPPGPPGDEPMPAPSPMGNIPSAGMPSPADDGSAALDELIRGMNNKKDNQDASDVNDIEDMDDDPLSAITVIAQATPPPNAPDIEVEDEVLGNPEPSPEPSKGPIVVPAQPKASELPKPTKLPSVATEPQEVDLTDPFETALASVSVVDVVTRLEALANIFRNREIARQLAIIDLMMDKLGIASFFPSLAEASSKSLESNQYALTRIEDILSKLRGSIETPLTHQVNLTGPADQVAPPVTNANPEQIKQNLLQNKEEEKAKKERRKQMEEAKQTPQITNAPEELAQPVNIQEPPIR